MKRVFAAALLAAFVLSLAPAALAMDPVPDLVGKWSGRVEIHHSVKGFIVPDSPSLVFEIKEQVGHTFHGVKSWTTAEGSFSETFSGVVSADGKKVSIAEHEDGLILGDILGDGHMALYYMEHGDSPKAIYYDLKRQ